MVKWQLKYSEIRNFLLGLWSGEFLVFLFFLAVSTAFWFMSTLNETYEMELQVPLTVTDVPKNIIITEDFPDTIKVGVRDRGFNLLSYMMPNAIQPLRVSFATYSDKNGQGSIAATEIQKMMKTRLSESTTIQSVKATHLDFYYCYGTKKRVPVIFDGVIRAKKDYYVTGTKLSSDSVTILAAEEVLDTITAVHSTPLEYDGLTSSFKKKLELKHIKGVKFASSNIYINVYVDQLTEVMFNVEVHPINVPNKIALKTFPARVDVRVSVGVKQAHKINPNKFYIVADYNDLSGEHDDRLPIRITRQPSNIVKAYLKVSEVDYIIEHL